MKKLLFIILTLILITGCQYPLGGIEELKIEKEKILFHVKLKDKKNRDYIKYYWEEEMIVEQNEVIEKRTRNSKVYNLGNGKYHVSVRLGMPYEKRGNKWYGMKDATTTVEIFNKTALIKSAMAATVGEQVGASGDDADQAGAGDNADLVGTEQNIGDVAGDGTWTFGARFQTVAVPKDATISNATISLKATWAGDNDVNTLVYAEDADDCSIFTQADGPTDRMAAKTTANVAWEPGAWTEDVFEASGDISAVLQEIVERAGWATGQDICILVAENGSTQWDMKEVYTFDNGAANAPKLDFDYEEAAVAHENPPEIFIVE